VTSKNLGRLTIENAVIFDGKSPDLRDGSIHMIGDRIIGFDDAVDTAGQVINARGRVVIPGLIDAHFHAYGISLTDMKNEVAPLSYLALAGAQRLNASLCRGFTTVRDVAGGDIGLATALADGLFEGPRYLYTGPAMSQTGGHGDPREADDGSSFHGGRMCEVVDGIEDLRKSVRERFRTGSHAIKIMTSGGVTSPVGPVGLPQYSSAEVRVVVEEASRRGSYVAAHAYSPKAIQHAVLNGVRSIEHGNLLDHETALLMASHGAYLVPTLIAYESMDRHGEEFGLSAVGAFKNKEVLEATPVAIAFARAAGVPVGFGTDLIGKLESEQLHGLRLQSEVMGVYECLKSATSVNALLLQRDDLGIIAEGNYADLVLLDGNPFDDPAVLWDERRPRTVIKSGAIVGRR
jgi:imidazolonepropionase-like amidohydrolase